MPSAYQYMAMWYRKVGREVHERLMRSVLIKWRKEPAIVRVERPFRLERARKLGYKPKQGVVVARVRLIRGPFNRRRPDSGRRPKRMGVYGITAWKSWRQVAEERAARKFPGLEVLNSYWVADDGIYRYFEVILIDCNQPTIQRDPLYSGICGREVPRRRLARRLRERQRKLIEHLKKTLLPKLKGTSTA
ncbi:50S ribosomal protein L15e [Pyrobaculum calidifontis]|uniref:50S ribosomal protein L15e n=1 Tax=Pyrobaculum calidifontis (strain DSM 21063 / JCM 11548 / VA1) TaxID=410359 RepID=A3MWR6_PYRCJ|nr:50S ribosomal protein L15e [Pyrobaculum calidifontis]ABO09083.1 LSU ribosomal protein L15E [Pyrobaculum calidifontis JCM 11548]